MILAFGGFELDPGARELRLLGEVVPIEPKPFDLLLRLIEHRDRVVSKDELFEHVWPDAIVSDWALTSAVKGARRALRRAGEDSPVQIKTSHGRGFRFVGEVGEQSQAQHQPALTPPIEEANRGESNLVGRTTEIEQLESLVTRVGRDGTHVAFLSGESGIGKTALVDEFLERVTGARTARGQSVEHYGQGEPYLPVLEAWGRLLRDPANGDLRNAMRRVAPTWLAQLPSVADSSEHGAEGTRDAGSTQERMLREMAELLEVATSDRPLVLAIEDLHWSDPSTLELVTYVARKRGPARVLIVGTFRDDEAAESDHPLRSVLRDIVGRGDGTELRLGRLTEGDIEAYLAARLGSEASIPAELSRRIFARTEGHPLFVENVLSFGLAEKRIVRDADAWRLEGDLEGFVPETVRQMIERQVESLPVEDGAMLEAASVAGRKFSVAAIAAGLDESVDALEERCELLAWRNRLIEDGGVEEWPDGAISGRYRFKHALYVDVLYGRVASARRVRLHRRIGDRKESAYAEDPSAIASELAAHFEAARDGPRALEYHELAGDSAFRRHAAHEALAHYRAALSFLSSLPKAQQQPRELDLLAKTLRPMVATRGWATLELAETCERALRLADCTDPGQHHALLFSAAIGLRQVRVEKDGLEDLCGAFVAHAEEHGDTIDLATALVRSAECLEYLGDVRGAESMARRALAVAPPVPDSESLGRYGGTEPRITAQTCLGSVLWSQGRPEQSAQALDDAVARAAGLAHPLSTCHALWARASGHLVRNEPVPARERIDAARKIAREEGFTTELLTANTIHGWVQISEGCFLEAADTLTVTAREFRALGTEVFLPLALTLLGTAHAAAGDLPRALEVFDEATERSSRFGENPALAIVLRTRAAFLLLSGNDKSREEAEALWRSAASMSRQCGDLMGEIDAVVRLGQLWLNRGEVEAAREVVLPVYEKFTEGFDVQPLREARAVLRAAGVEPAAPPKRPKSEARPSEPTADG